MIIKKCTEADIVAVGEFYDKHLQRSFMKDVALSMLAMWT